MVLCEAVDEQVLVTVVRVEHRRAAYDLRLNGNVIGQHMPGYFYTLLHT